MSTAVISSDKPPRKFPPPCWTQEEALALIEAYKERWYALRRGYLRTNDWDAVATAVGERCPGASPPKTSAQCRHKMEKLRQRYRAEKQRALSYPGRFFSSWFFFDSMDAMENGTNHQTQTPHNLVTIAKKIEPDLDPLPGYRNSPPFDFRVNKSTPNVSHRLSNNYSPYLDYGSDEDMDDGLGFTRSDRVYRNSTPQFEDDGFRSKKYPKTDDWDNRIDSNGQVWVKVPSDRNPGGYRGKYSGHKSDRNSNPNGYSPGFGKKTSGGGVKRGRDPVAEMVSSIRLLGEGFMKMEKMKMEMAKDIEKMRMEMEMKRNDMLLESQHQIVDAFLKGLLENKNKAS